MNSLRQAVILCGGRGTRLGSVTDNCPKPMVVLNGKPFLEYLLLQLKASGIRKVLLLTGYLGEQIGHYFHTGSEWGIEISYSHGPVEWNTARRLFEAKLMLDEIFMLMYSDNFINFSLQKLMDFHAATGKSLTLMLAAKENGNIRIKPTGEIAEYDPGRTKSDLNYVEIGYMIVLNREIWKYYDGGNSSFSKIISGFTAANNAAGFIMYDRYYSVSDQSRMHKAERFLTAKKILLIDRDGVLNEKAPKAEYITRWEEFRWIPGVIDALSDLAKAGFKFIVISNQAGVARGIIDAEHLRDIHERMSQVLHEHGIEILRIYVCPHAWDANCTCRKPQPGMLFQAAAEFELRLDEIMYVGDDPRDCQAAYNANSNAVFIGDYRALAELNRPEMPLVAATSLADAIPQISAFYARHASTQSEVIVQ